MVAESENFVEVDGIVVLFVICLLDELFLQFFKPCLNAVWRGVSAPTTALAIFCCKVFKEKLNMASKVHTVYIAEVKKFGLANV